MDNQIGQKLKDLIASGTSFGVAVGSDPTLDEMGAALSLYLMLKNAGKEVSIASPTDPIVEVSSLVGVDKVKKTLGGGSGGDLTVSFPYTEGEIEKVSYTQEEGFLNIIVKAGEGGLSFGEKDVKFTRGGGALDAVFVIGTPYLAEVDSLFDTENPDIKIINIDNKQENEGYGDVVLVASRLSSVSEGVADLALVLGLNIDADSAQNLLNGITYATGNFQNKNTSPLAFEMVSLLMKKGAVREVPESATKGISMMGQRDDRKFQNRNQPQNRNQSSQRQDGQRKSDIRQSRGGFEQKLQERVRQERDREARQGQQGNNPPGNKPQPQTQPRVSNQQDADVIGEAPIDWLAPKVYKGSSDV